jgi:hypothetical protein
VIPTPAVLVVFLIGAIIGVVGWTTVAYMVPGQGDIERSILGDETYNREFDD